MPADTSPETLIAQAQELIERVRRDLQAGEAFYGEHGLDPEQLARQATPQDIEKAQALVRQDLEEVEQAVAHAAQAAPAAERPPLGSLPPNLA
ncbi:hypothetical protein V8Z80_13035 [Orrella sp. JC864]|uniref:hypothetical protein n=1 Tax=Orrella sp. JC864 TaxID=3120298 RepID=UPI003008FC9A